MSEKSLYLYIQQRVRVIQLMAERFESQKIFPQTPPCNRY